jgi:predicted Zn-ribbon and HTH transcriptional regulator
MQVERLLRLKHELSDLTEATMMSQAFKEPENITLKYPSIAGALLACGYMHKNKKVSSIVCVKCPKCKSLSVQPAGYSRPLIFMMLRCNICGFRFEAHKGEVM